MVALLDTQCGLYMAETSDKLARQHGISREEMDAYALRSQQAAGAAAARGVFREEIVPVDAPQGRKTVRVEADDHPRPETTLEGLAALRPAFGKDGLVTAGNASGIVDGAAALVVASREAAAQAGGKPLCRVVSWASAGVPPEIMGIGPVPASRKALAAAGLELADVDLVEINEAFAGQYLAVEKELGLVRERTNVNGGAIALGHPLGATGARLLLTLALELARRQGRYGLAAACIGGGQGIAVVIEREG
jgi:acetyl-CoA acetyltransferase family protein